MPRRKRKKNRLKLIRLTVMIIISVVAIVTINGLNPHKKSEKNILRDNIYDFLTVEENQELAFTNAIELNYGSSENSCVYFVAEVLRKNGYSIPEATANTNQLISVLDEKGWERDFDYSKLKPGDICFTTDHTGSKEGKPTHTYVFMGWVEEGNYDYAYICDNQAKDYEGNIYHIRNVKDRVNTNGLTKDAFSFFMKDV